MFWYQICQNLDFISFFRQLLWLGLRSNSCLLAWGKHCNALFKSPFWWTILMQSLKQCYISFSALDLLFGRHLPRLLRPDRPVHHLPHRPPQGPASGGVGDVQHQAVLFMSFVTGRRQEKHFTLFSLNSTHLTFSIQWKSLRNQVKKEASAYQWSAQLIKTCSLNIVQMFRYLFASYLPFDPLIGWHCSWLLAIELMCFSTLCNHWIVQCYTLYQFELRCSHHLILTIFYHCIALYLHHSILYCGAPTT